MGWLMGLYKTYENNSSLLQDRESPLIPICHTTQQAQIEVILTGEGGFLGAAVVPKAQNTTLIPCTEQSASRAGTRPVNHPLCDKLQYVAGDFAEFGGTVTSGFAKVPTEPHSMYLQDLRLWVESPYSHPKLKAILHYIEQRTLIRDLVAYGVLHLDEDGRLLRQWGSDNPPEIFQVIASTQVQCDAFVRWVVQTPGELETKVWRDKDLIQSWIDYYVSGIEQDICYVTGEEVAIARFHPSKIRNDGDKAKIISGNDERGLTFRGRFEDASQAASIGFEAAQKAHNMLRWLVRNQGFLSGDLAIVAWAPGGGAVPSPVDASADLLGGSEELDPAYTAEEFALRLRNKILGLQANLGEFAGINVIALNSATQGRMAIGFYRELRSSEFFSRLENWHNAFAWQHSYRPKGYVGRLPQRYIGAPSLFDIAEAAYGRRLDNKLKARTVERLLPCVIDGKVLPPDILEGAVRKTSNRVAFEEEWEWWKSLTITCSLYKGTNIREGYEVALDVNRTERDYLYGRLLAYADNLERWALTESDKKRATNAARMMHRFAERPYSTWRTIELSLKPYLERLGAKGAERQKGLSRVMSLFTREKFVDDSPLSGEFLLGYHSQMVALWDKLEQDEIESED